MGKINSFFLKESEEQEGEQQEGLQQEKSFSAKGEHDFRDKTWHENRENITSINGSLKIRTVRILAAEISSSKEGTKIEKESSIKLAVRRPYNVRPVHRNQGQNFLYDVCTIRNPSVLFSGCTIFEEVACTFFEVVFGGWKEYFSVVC